MAFVVDGSEWCFDGWSEAEIDSALGAFLERVTTAQSRGERVWIGDDIYTRPVLGGLSVWELLSPGAAVKLDNEILEKLAAALGRATRYLDEESWPVGMEYPEIVVGEGPASENADVYWAHHRVRAGRAVACLALRRSGVYLTGSAAGAVKLHWVIDERGHRAFFRSAIDVERDTAATLERLAPHAYPDTFFLPGVWRGLSDFEGGYTRVREELRRYLDGFDDHGWWVFMAPSPLETELDRRPPIEGRPDQRLIERRFSLCGLEMAPENANVAQHKTCRQARERTLKGRTLYCQWHGKIEPHINRIHIHPPIPESGNRIVVAIFHAHLPLPGD